MTSQETRWKRLIIRWTAPKGFAALLLFLASAFLLEYLIVYSFQSGGLIDRYTWIQTLQVPYVNWNFTLAVSPMLHFLPASVMIVLVSTWAFLARHLAFIPQSVASAKQTAVRRPQPKRRRFEFARKSFQRVNRSMQKVGKALREAFLRIPGFSKLSRRLFFARTAIRSATIVLLAFVSIALLAYSLAYPWWIHDAVVNFYHGNPSFMWFVTGAQESLKSVMQALAPVNNALLAAAPGFRNGLQGFAASAEQIAKLDITGKYLLVQSLAAWMCALIALAYGRYVGARRYKRR